MGPSALHTLLHDPRLSAHAVSPLPAWLWSLDARRILWANPTAAAIFGAASAAVLAQQQFEPSNSATAQIARIAGTLADGGAARLERLRGFGAGFGRALTCLCSRIALINGTSSVLVVATERAGPDLPFPERVRRLLDGIDAPLAAFGEEGRLLHATPAALAKIGEVTELTALGGKDTATQARVSGHAEADSTAGRIVIDRIGSGTAILLLARIEEATKTAEPTMPAAAQTPAPDLFPASTAVAEPDAALPVSEPLQPAPPETPNFAAFAERKHPLRFVWQMDADGVFSISSDEFTALIGPRSAAALGQPWPQMAATLGVDPDSTVTKALSSRDTWSGIVVPWPVDGSDERLPIELSGLPVFDRNRTFRGYRGFGVCRDLTRLSALAIARSFVPPPAIETIEPPVETPATTSESETDTKAAESFAENVVPFRSPNGNGNGPHNNGDNAPALSPIEHSAFSELGRRLSERLRSEERPGADDVAEAQASSGAAAATAPLRNDNRHETERSVLDRLPVGVLVYRLNDLLYANRAFLDWTGYATLQDLAEAGGLDSLFIEPSSGGNSGTSRSLTISTQNGTKVPVEGRLLSVTWQGDNALALMLYIAPPDARPAAKSAPQTDAETRELRAILDTANDGVLVVDRGGHILSANRSAEALFGYEGTELTARSFADLFAQQSQAAALTYLDRMIKNGTAAMLNQGCDVVGQVRDGGPIPLFLTLGRIGDSGEKICAIFRDMTAWKKTEKELHKATREAEKAAAGKADMLAKISHELRTPLNAMIGFAEVMMDERFGPIGNERYREYLRDIHGSGTQVVALLNDLIDLSKIEAGKLELTFAPVNLNDITLQCVAIMQAQANRDRIIIRTALSSALPQIIADARAVRQITLNLLANAIKFTPAGGQVIISTTLTDAGEVMLRVRDTGAGMSEKDLQTALEPFRQLPTSARWGSGGTGLGLPLTKALAEANHAAFKITSEINTGTLVEIAFPAAHALAK